MSSIGGTYQNPQAGFCLGNGLPRSNAHWLAMTGVVGEPFAPKTIPFGGAVGAVPPEGSFLVPARKLPKKPAGEGLS